MLKIKVIYNIARIGNRQGKYEMLENSSEINLKGELIHRLINNKCCAALSGCSASTKMQSGYALGAFLFQHIFAFAWKPSVSFYRKSKNVIYLERYVKYGWRDPIHR